MPRLFVIGDVGGPGHYHLGDEAMLEANLHMFRQLVPGIEFTVASRDPAWTSKRYGVESVAIPFGEEITGSLRNCAGLVVSGGGNLCATWPEKASPGEPSGITRWQVSAVSVVPSGQM